MSPRLSFFQIEEDVVFEELTCTFVGQAEVDLHCPRASHRRHVTHPQWLSHGIDRTHAIVVVHESPLEAAHLVLGSMVGIP